MAQTYSDKPTLAAWNEVLAAVGSAPKIALGSYTGNGQYGSSHPNSITFDFEPKLLLVQNASGTTINVTNNNASNVFILALRSMNVMYYQDSVYNYIRWEGNTVIWYCATAAHWQLNANGHPYYYLAIG